MDQVGEEGDRPRKDEDDGLDRGRRAEDCEADGDRPYACPRANDRAVDETMRMVTVMVVRRGCIHDRLGKAWSDKVPMRPALWMAVHVTPVPMESA